MSASGHASGARWHVIKSEGEHARAAACACNCTSCCAARGFSLCACARVCTCLCCETVPAYIYIPALGISPLPPFALIDIDRRDDLRRAVVYGRHPGRSGL
jgi:hypothetical protein